MSTYKRLGIKRVIPETLDTENKIMSIGNGFYNLMYTDTSNNRALHKFHYLFDNFQSMNDFVRAHATPFDKSGKLGYNYIDLRMQDNGLVSYMPNEKGIELYSSDDVRLYSLPSRQTMKFGKFIKSFFNPILLQKQAIGDVDIEKISEFVKSKMSTEDYEFVVISGDEIKWAYHHNSYMNADISGGDASSSLTGSCMRYDKCQEWFELYTKNDFIKMLVLKHKPSGKVAARALLWNDIDFKPDWGSQIKINFMDRVYAYREWMIAYMLDWGTANGYYRKKMQSINEKSALIDTSGQNVSGFLTFTIKEPIEYYPYMDTFTYLKSDKITFSNSENGANWSLTSYQDGNAVINAKPKKTCAHCDNRFNVSDVHTISGRFVCTSCRETHYVIHAHTGGYIRDYDSHHIDGTGYVYDHETTYDELSGANILTEYAVEAEREDGSFTWTHIDRTTLATNGERYVDGHPEIFEIEGQYYHISDTFVCAYDGIRYASNSERVIVDTPNTVADVHDSNIEAYMADNNLTRDDDGNIIDMLTELITESPTVEAIPTAPTRTRGRRSSAAQ
jgi:hypothetical protein